MAKNVAATSIAGLGNFHKTLPHDKMTGLVDAAAYKKFEQIAQKGGDFDQTPQSAGASPLINPQAGWAKEHLGPDPSDMDMPPPPSVTSDASAAEMTELFWMALLRDKAFQDFTSTDSDLKTAIQELTTVYQRATGELAPGRDLPSMNGALDLNLRTIFRSGLPGENAGPLVSQFFLHDVAYGTQIILQKQFPYRAGRDYLLSWDDWLHAQNTGRDNFGNDYPSDNDFSKDKMFFEDDAYQPQGLQGLRRIRNMRDLARFVNKDALHQAYFNAALLLLNWKAPASTLNPYANGSISRQVGFGTLGGPHLLTLVSEVANRALKVIWRQKWGVYRRHRPEVYAGLMEAQDHNQGQFGLPPFVFQTTAAQRIHALNGKNNYLLPMAFSAGSPAHPSYGAGHATVAGACVTVLKAWFHENEPIANVLKGNTHPITRAPVQVVMPDRNGSDTLPAYTGSDVGNMTVGGELNKIASNVAMGRSMGGVHWRSDNTRSLRLGEKIATIILRRESKDYKEKLSWGYTNFDGNEVVIGANGKVSVSNDPALEKFYNQSKFAPF
jgi:hypothetical protein